jgi:outer membrane lipoprotein-sorting protein
MAFFNVQLGSMPTSVPGKRARRSARVLIVAVWLAAALPVLAQSLPAPQPALTADEIARNLELRNQARNNALHHFEGTRTYTLHYYGFPNSQSAEMVVTMSYQSPSTKDFKIVSQTGSRFIIDHVFKRMLESEREAAQDQSRNALTSANYEFSLAGYEQTPEGNCYVLKVTPRTNNKFLYRGKIWIDAADFAMVKIEAEPAQNPSFFINRTEVHHRYKKVENFWLPAENRTTSYLRIGGHADLSIEYREYNITAADPLPAATTAAQNVSPGTRESDAKAGSSE